MKKITCLLVGMAIILVVLGGVYAASQSRDDVVVTYDPSGKKLISYAEYMARVGPPGPFRIERVYKSPSKGTGKILLIVNSSIQSSIQTALNQYKSDLETAGYTVVIYASSGGTPNDLRGYLQGQSTGLVGVILIGDLPIPWFEIDYDFDGTDPDSLDNEYANFPCDLFYMDLDGTWEDNQSTYPFQSGVFDNHTDGSGDRGPEIWVGRLTSSPMTLSGTEVTLLNNYFTKNHNFREGNLYPQERALVYVDDDWYSSADDIDGYVGSAYPTRLLVKDKATTCRDDYRDTRLIQSFEWMHVMLHSSWEKHFFKVNDQWEMDGPDYATVTNQDVENIDPVAIFYDLFACSNCRYVETDYMGGWYIFVEDHGLGAVGCTKTGSMWDFDLFYGPLGQAKSLGQSFKEWFAAQAPYDSADVRWYYGMTLLGDAALTLRPRTLSTSPGMNNLGVAANTHISLAFDQGMILSSFNSSSFSVHGSRSGPHSGTYSYKSDTKIFTFDPDNEFIDGELVTTILPRKVKSEDNVPPMSHIWSFTVGIGNPTQGVFSSTGTYPGGSSPDDILSNDFNLDGYPDLATVNHSWDSLTVLLNGGDGSFTSYRRYPTGDYPTRIASGDFSGDGDVDLAVNNSHSHQLSVYLNDGTGHYSGPTNYGTSSNYPNNVIAGDFDGDNDLDLALFSQPNDFQHWLDIFKNDGTGNFTQTYQYFMIPGGGLRLELAGDMDGDGDLDLAGLKVGDYGVWDDSLAIFFNSGDGQFSYPALYAVPDGPCDVYGNDLDGDGDIDFAVSSVYTDTLCVLFNDGDGAIAATDKYYISGRNSYSICCGDWDGDGDIDLAQTIDYPSDQVYVLKNDGYGTFGQAVTYASSAPYALIDGDFDRDGDLDLAVAKGGGGSATVEILTNDGTPDLISPAAIADLSNSVVGDTFVNLIWTAPGDDGNLGRADFYDLRYSTVPVGKDTASWWISPDTDTVPNEPSPSLAGITDSCTVTGLLPDTTYYFVIKTGDEVPNWSGFSNVATVTLVGVSQGVETAELPTSYKMSQNYPNPFNPITQIRYALPKDCQVRLEVYNVIGQKVATLVNGEQKAGYKMVTWDAYNLSSGIYFYRIQASNFTDTKKMILLR